MSVLARRTYKPADERREQILDCALEVFAGKGYHGASIADVCERAKIGRATLYQYFEDKTDVLRALADRIAARVTAACEARPPLVLPEGFVPTADQARRFAERRLATVLSAVFEDARATRLILRAARGADGVVDEVLARIDRVVLGMMEDDLRACQRIGLLRAFDPAFTARFFLGGIEKIVLAEIDLDHPIDVAAIAHQAVMIELFGTLFRTGDPTEIAAPRAPAAPKKKKPTRRRGAKGHKR